MFAHHWMMIVGAAKLFLGSDDEAVTRFRRAIELNRNYSFAHLHLGAALVHLNRLDEARSAVQAGLALTPTFTLRRFRAGTSNIDPVYLAQRERLVEGMRKAGVPV
jgi:tetratricopeptide (TPR) repeat protein